MSKSMRIKINSIKTYLSKPQNVILILTGMLPMITVNIILTRAYLQAEINSVRFSASMRR